MRAGLISSVLAVGALALAAPAQAAPAKTKSTDEGRPSLSRHPHGRLVYAPASRRGASGRGAIGRGAGFADLVGDPDSGLGFYPLPARYRIGARRYRLRHERPPWQNPVLFAIAADAARYSYWIPANREYRYGVFNPYDGLGTPFFAGYYGPAGGDDEPRPLFGRPYRN